MTPAPDDTRVDELRQQLRALGYLDAGVDRFVLAPARSRRRPSAIAALASVRVGVLAGALLGPAAAIGIRARLPALVTGTTDAIVIALYLAVLFGVVATAFSFLASMLVAIAGGRAAATRARIISRAAGSLVALSSLAYLTLWWRSANGEAWSSPVWTAAALLVAVVISLLLGHAVAITTFAVIAARHPAHITSAPGPSTSRLVLAAGAVAFAGAAGLLVLAAPGAVGETDRPHLAVVSPGVKVRVIAIDGFDPAVYESLRSQARVPALAAVFSTASPFGAADVHDPARAWATIATGQPPDVHGLHSLETRRVAGLEGTFASGDQDRIGRAIRGATDVVRLTRPAIASGRELRAKTFWEVASEAGLRTVVVNWWATWPAGGSGLNAPVILSDRATLRLERGGELDAEIAPKEAYEKLRPLWPVLKERAAQEAARVVPQTIDPAISAIIRRSAELDALQILLLNHVEEDATDLVAVYLPGLDIAQHALLGAGDSPAPSTLAARLEAVRAYYEYLSDLIAGLVGDLRLDNELVLIVTQPGRLPSTSQGLIAAIGRMSSSGRADAARPIDAAPTILYALGLPLSRELPGRPLVSLLAPSVVQQYPVREVPSYGPRRSRTPFRQGQTLDDEMVERLRSLGYVR